MGLKRLFTGKKYSLQDNNGNVTRYRNFDDAYRNARSMSENVQSGQNTAKYDNSENYWNSSAGQNASSFGYNNQFDYAYANARNNGLSRRAALQSAMAHWGPENETPLYLNRRDYMNSYAGEDTTRKEKRKLYRTLKKDNLFNDYSSEELRGMALNALNGNYSYTSNPRISDEFRNSVIAQMRKDGENRILEKFKPVKKHDITITYTEPPIENKEDPSIRAKESMSYLTPEELIRFGQSGISPVTINNYDIPQESVTMNLEPSITRGANLNNIPMDIIWTAQRLGLDPTEYWNALQSKNNGR